MVRGQVAVYSPVSAAALGRAFASGLGSGLNGHSDGSVTLEREYSAERAFLCGSGTQALQVALLLAMRQVGDACVALPAFTCFDVASAAVGVRARIRFYDLVPSTLAPDLESLQGVLERGTRI